MTDALLLDYNGVLVNDEPLHFAAFRDVMLDHGLELDEQTYFADYLGCDDRSAFVEAWRRAHRTMSGELLRVLVADKADRYAALTDAGAPAVPGAAAFVAAAAERWPVAVVSGALRREVESGLRSAGLATVVRVVVAAEDSRATKPDPSGHRIALQQLAQAGARPTRAVVIEDSLPGLGAARAIGAGCVLLATSLPRARLGAADLVWDDFAGHAPAELAPLFRPLAP